VNGTMAHLFDVLQNRWHRTLDGRPYGAWADGPLNPYRIGGDSYFQLPHSENYRIRIPQSQWGNRLSWSMDPDSSSSAYDSPRERPESQYDFRHWIMGIWSSPGALVALTHHEWYTATTPDGMFLGTDWWITGIGHLTMSQVTGRWSLTGANDFPTSKRLILVPQPSSTISNPGLPKNSPFFGFAHPSNIVYSNGYYYAFTTAQSLAGGTTARGVALARTSNVALAVDWQFWNGSSWTTVDHNTYQGNGNPGQSPYMFWANWEYGGELAGMNVRQHISGRWLIVGRDQQVDRPLLVSSTASLSNPIDLESSLQVVPVSFPSGSGKPVYYSLFDPTATGAPGDLNYQMIGSTPLLVATMDDAASFYHQFLTLTGW
jgi:hypothetical protein